MMTHETSMLTEIARLTQQLSERDDYIRVMESIPVDDSQKELLRTKKREMEARISSLNRENKALVKKNDDLMQQIGVLQTYVNVLEK